MKANITFYSLFYLDETAQDSLINLNAKQSKKYSIYIQNAISLSKSLKQFNFSYNLIVNDKKSISSLLEEIDCLGDLVLHEIDFSLKVPEGINFYSAHFKLDVIKFLSQLDGYNILLDLDMIAINPPSGELLSYANNNIPLYYDITDQTIPAYGYRVILSDMKVLSDDIQECRWAGGEFLAGDAKFFGLLHKEVMGLYDRYTQTYKTLFHQGDEMLVSVALQLMRVKYQMYIADVGPSGMVFRYWGTQPKHPQKSLDYMNHIFLLHLPSDKTLLIGDLQSRSSIKKYLYKKLLLRNFISKIYRLFKK